MANVKARKPLSRLSIALSRTVKKLRIQSGLSLDGMAQRAGISRAMWHQIECGKSSPTVALLEKIADAFALHPAELLTYHSKTRVKPGEIIGQPKGRTPESVADHFVRCPGCGEWIDCRDLGMAIQRVGELPHGPSIKRQ